MTIEEIFARITGIHHHYMLTLILEFLGFGHLVGEDDNLTRSGKSDSFTMFLNSGRRIAMMKITKDKITIEKL